MANILITGCSSGIGLETAKLLKTMDIKYMQLHEKKKMCLCCKS